MMMKRDHGELKVSEDGSRTLNSHISYHEGAFLSNLNRWIWKAKRNFSFLKCFNLEIGFFLGYTWQTISGNLWDRKYVWGFLRLEASSNVLRYQQISKIVPQTAHAFSSPPRLHVPHHPACMFPPQSGPLCSIINRNVSFPSEIISFPNRRIWFLYINILFPNT